MIKRDSGFIFRLYRFNPSKEGEDPATVMREGLAKVLVFYHPLAGRFKYAPGSKLIVDYTGKTCCLWKLMPTLL